MNRNVNSFANNPVGVDSPRSTFMRNSTYSTTFIAGRLIPFYLDEVLPGDTFDVNTSLVCRMSTPIFPVMDDAYLDTFYFFVPHRLVWDHWKNLNGENDNTGWVSEIAYQVPTINFYDQVFTGTILDYLGLPISVDLPDNLISALPLRSYKLIWNEWFRDENLMNPVYVNKGDQEDIWELVIEDGINQIYPFPVCKYHDYFTSALPSPQKGDPVKIPIDPQKVVTGAVHGTETGTNADNALIWQVATDLVDYTAGMMLNTFHPGNTDNETIGMTRGVLTDGTGFDLNDTALARPVNLYTDGNTAVSINDLRLAFATQRVLEMDARGGTRYNEMILSHFGVHVPDATIQRPEYLGGNRVNIRTNDVVQQSATETGTPIGTVSAYSKTADSHHSFTKSFTEHGYVIGLMCVRYPHTYSQNIQKLWTRKDRFDFYLPAFAHLGEQPIKNYEIYYNSAREELNDQVFGYQEAWAEYRYKPSIVTGLFRPNISAGLSSWNYSDYYTDTPILGSDWIAENSDNVERTLAVQNSDFNNPQQFIINMEIVNKTTRVMPLRSIPGLLTRF